MPLTITDTPQVVFEKCVMDIVGPLPETESGNRYLLMCQDALPKFTVMKPIPSQDAETILNIVLRYGIQQSIVTDQGSNFMSEMTKRTCKLLHVKKLTPLATIPNRISTLVKFFRHYVKHDQDDWDKWVPSAVFVFNTTPHSSTGFAPHKLL
ncbi:hypothetical protein PR048_009185 [Dryococelus australis]|uniref:Integrase catalytic domain-containing protein n=1 Tax=Dryococelus australis TaxID=614101 RepID=A0ABQ9HZA0_9NEOP|nr:hypothetical protein PR048_009185 [Dryococelus australis]